MVQKLMHQVKCVSGSGSIIIMEDATYHLAVADRRRAGGRIETSGRSLGEALVGTPRGVMGEVLLTTSA